VKTVRNDALSDIWRSRSFMRWPSGTRSMYVK